MYTGIDVAATVGMALVLFVATNVDDLFLLVGFFADRRFRAHHIAVGQYLGVGALVLASVGASLISLIFAPAYVGLLGFLPIAIGVKRLLELRRAGNDGPFGESSRAGTGLGNVLSVTAVTIANGGDNIAIYTPVFAMRSMPEVALISLVFAGMVGLWLAFSHWLVEHPALGAPMRRYGNIATPLVLVALGGLTLYEGGLFS